MISEGVYVKEEVYSKKEANATTDVNKQEDAHEGFTGPGRTAATLLFTSLASALAHDQLRQITHQPDQRSDATPYQARRLCGRWLTVQRLRRGVTAAMIADRVGVDADLLQLLELGLANDLSADDERWTGLALLLADRLHDADLVMAVLNGALGCSDESTDHALERIVDDLRTTPPESDNATV